MRFLELAWDALRNSVIQLVDWLNGLAAAGAFDPRNWPQLVWFVLALVVLTLVLVALVRRRRRGVSRALPEMMISHGEIVLLEEPADAQELAYDMTAPAQASHRLSLTLSNLNPWPVQLLELAVRTRGLRQPVVAEAGSVVPPNGAVDVVADLFDLPGDVGVVELFLYSNRGGRRTYKLSAPLEWEPWDKRFRIRALSSRVTPVGTLASQERRRNERRSYESAKRRQRQKEFAEATWRKAEEFSKQVKGRRVTAAEKRVAALAGEQMGKVTLNGGERRNVEHLDNGYEEHGYKEHRYEEHRYEEHGYEEHSYDERRQGRHVGAPVTERPQAQDRPQSQDTEGDEDNRQTEEPRRRLDFPDEF